MLEAILEALTASEFQEGRNGEIGIRSLYLVSSITSSISFNHNSASWFAGILP
jgi:hypothetical protein